MKKTLHWLLARQFLGETRNHTKKLWPFLKQNQNFDLFLNIRFSQSGFENFIDLYADCNQHFLNNKISIFNIFNENHKKGNFGSCVASYFFLTRSLLLFYLLPTVLSLFFLYVPLLYHRFSLQKTPETNETLFHFYDLFSGEGKVIKIAVKIFSIESMTN